MQVRAPVDIRPLSWDDFLCNTAVAAAYRDLTKLTSRTVALAANLQAGTVRPMMDSEEKRPATEIMELLKRKGLRPAD